MFATNKTASITHTSTDNRGELAHCGFLWRLGDSEGWNISRIRPVRAIPCYVRRVQTPTDAARNTILWHLRVWSACSAIADIRALQVRSRLSLFSVFVCSAGGRAMYAHAHANIIGMCCCSEHALYACICLYSLNGWEHSTKRDGRLDDAEPRCKTIVRRWQSSNVETRHRFNLKSTIVQYMLYTNNYIWLWVLVITKYFFCKGPYDHSQDLIRFAWCPWWVFNWHDNNSFYTLSKWRLARACTVITHMTLCVLLLQQHVQRVLYSSIQYIAILCTIQQTGETIAGITTNFNVYALAIILQSDCNAMRLCGLFNLHACARILHGMWKILLHSRV